MAIAAQEKEKRQAVFASHGEHKERCREAIPSDKGYRLCVTPVHKMNNFCNTAMEIAPNDLIYA